MDAETLRLFLFNKKRDLAEEKKKFALRLNPDIENIISNENNTLLNESDAISPLNSDEKFESLEVNHSDDSALSKTNSFEKPTQSDENLECEYQIKDEPSYDISKLIRKLTSPEIGMLRVGEYSPNNPELAADSRNPRGGDAFLGFGLYEEKRKKLLQKRQNEYKEYLAKQNQYLKAQKPRHQPGRNLFLEDNKTISNNNNDWNKNTHTNMRRPSSVAVQTDPDEMALMLTDRKMNNNTIIQAERELSPRPSLSDNLNQPDWKMHVDKVNIGTQNNLIVPPSLAANKKYTESDNLYDPFNDMSNNMFRKESPRAKLLQDLRHTYMPSLFDAEAIKHRNMKMEEEAAAKRAVYQSELKKQIEEQQKLKEERKAREKLIEEAETRRLEEQLKMLKLSKENEIMKQNEIVSKMRSDATEFERRRQLLQNEIETEKQNLRTIKMKTLSDPPANRLIRSDPNSRLSEPVRENFSKLSQPIYNAPSQKRIDEPDIDLLSYNVKRNNPYVGQDLQYPKPNYSTNITDNPIYPKSYSHESASKIPYVMHKSDSVSSKQSHSSYFENTHNTTKPKYEPAFLNKRITEMIEINPNKKNGKQKNKFDDSLPIPVLREPEKRRQRSPNTNNLNSEGMINSDHKWKVPAVQKNILQNNFTEEGKQENILTQLGSIRRQLQLEQLKLDQSQFFSNQKLVK